MVESEGITPQTSDPALRVHANDLDLESCEPAKTKESGLRRRLRVQPPRKERFSKLRRIFSRLDFSWITANLDASHLKPVVRVAVSTWICGILLVASKPLSVMGQVSFYLLLYAYLLL